MPPRRRWERTTSPPGTISSGDLVADGRRLGSRLLWAVAAQASSSTTNLILYVGILASSDAESFGRLVAILGVYHLVLALSRSLVSEPMVANDRPTSAGGAFSWVWARRRYRLIGGAAAVGVVVVGWLVDADRSTVVAVAAATPLLIGQDGVRNLAWSRRRADLAVGLDAVWLVLTAGLLGWLLVGGGLRPIPVILSWLTGGVVSGLVAGRLVPRLLADAGPNATATPTPTPTATATTVAGTVAPPAALGPADRSTALPDEQLHRRRHSHAALVTARNLLPIVVATVVGPVPAGLLKAGLLPFTPILTVFAGLRLVALPAMQRAAEAGLGGSNRPSAALDRLVGRLVGWYGAVAGVAAVVTVLLVEVVVEALSGSGAVEAGTRPEVVRWGAVVAVITVMVRPLAEAVAFGQRSTPIRRLRGFEIGVEWTGVFAAVALAGPDHVMVGWAVGMAAGGLVWVAARPGVGRRGH